MRKRGIAALLLTAALLLAGCSGHMRLPAEPRIYTFGADMERGCAYLAFGEQYFVPYCPAEAEYIGDCIGYCEIPGDAGSAGSRSYICDLQGYAPEEWIVLADAGESMIYREIRVQDIPQGLTSEYDWNIEKVHRVGCILPVEYDDLAKLLGDADTVLVGDMAKSTPPADRDAGRRVGASKPSRTYGCAKAYGEMWLREKPYRWPRWAAHIGKEMPRECGERSRSPLATRCWSRGKRICCF